MKNKRGFVLKNKDRKKKHEHESYGMIGISNQYSNIAQPLFGSSIKHDRFISLRIKTANVERNLHQGWFFGKDEIIEVLLSASQFTQMITSPNLGDGVPCTITHHNGERKEKPPYMGQNEIFSEELKDDFKKAMKDADELIATSTELLTKKGNLKVSEKKELLRQIKALSQHIHSNMPFVHKQFTRAMDKTVNVAKAEIENFYNSTIMKLGKKALKKLNKPETPRIEK
jgi:hypothetical protein